MKREELKSLFESAAVAQGLTFYSGTEKEMDGNVRNYPAAWLAPPSVKSKTGREEGEIVYRAALHLAALPASTENDALWENLEEKALAIVREITAADAVSGVGAVSVSAAKQSLTTHGEVSVTLECEITMWYYL